MDDKIKGLVAGGAAALGTAVTAVAAAAQDDEGIAAAGNGGVAEASANGGAVGVGDILSGGNFGGLIGVGDVGSVYTDKYGHVYTTDAAVAIEGSDVSSSTALDISANGGVGVADASGGDNNFAATVEDDGLAFVS